MRRGLILTIAWGCVSAVILSSFITASLTLRPVRGEGQVIELSSPTGDITGTPQKNPILTAEGNNIYLLWTGNLPDNMKTLFIRSQDGGLTFTNRTQLADKVMNSPSMSASGNNVYLVWDDPSQKPYEVYFRRSIDAGTSFEPPVNLSDNVEFSRSPRMVSTENNVYVAWFDGTSSSNRNQLFLKSSNNNGTTFSEKVTLSDNAVDTDVQLRAVGNNVYVMWQDLDTETYDIMLAFSTDSGNSFRKLKLNEDNSDLAFLGSISAIDNDVYVAWYERTGEFASHVLFRSSHDNGYSFKPALALSSDTLTVASEIPKVVSSGDSVYVMWRDGYANGNADLVLRSSNDKGATFGDISRISAIKGPFPQIDASDSNSYLAWENSNSTNSDVFLAGIAGTGTIVNVHNVSNNTGHSASPQIVAQGKEVFLIWIDFTDSSQLGEIFYAKSADGELLGPLRITYDNVVAEADNDYDIELQPLALTTSIDNKNYTVFGKSQNVTVTSFTIHPNWGISILLTPQEKDGVMALALPKDIIDGMQHVDITIDDFTLGREFDQLNVNSTHTVVNFVVPAGARQIDIKGTQVVPEFDSFVMFMIVASVIGVLVTAQRLGVKVRW